MRERGKDKSKRRVCEMWLDSRVKNALLQTESGKINYSLTTQMSSTQTEAKTS